MTQFSFYGSGSDRLFLRSLTQDPSPALSDPRNPLVSPIAKVRSWRRQGRRGRGRRWTSNHREQGAKGSHSVREDPLLMEAIVSRLEAIALSLEAIVFRLEAIALRLELGLRPLLLGCDVIIYFCE